MVLWTVWKDCKSAQRFTLPALRVPFAAPRLQKWIQTTVCKPLKPFTRYRASATASCSHGQSRMSTAAATGEKTYSRCQFVRTSSEIPSLSHLFSVPGVWVWVLDSRRRYCVFFSSNQQTRLSGLDNRCWETCLLRIWGESLERTSLLLGHALPLSDPPHSSKLSC